MLVDLSCFEFCILDWVEHELDLEAEREVEAIANSPLRWSLSDVWRASAIWPGSASASAHPHTSEGAAHPLPVGLVLSSNVNGNRMPARPTVSVVVPSQSCCQVSSSVFHFLFISGLLFLL